MRKFPLLPPDKRPQDPNLDGGGLRFETLDHGGEYPDTMPQAIRLTDALGRSCLYVPISQNGKVVDTEYRECGAARCGGLAERTYQGAGVLELRRDRLRGRGTTERAGKADIRTTVP